MEEELLGFVDSLFAGIDENPMAQDLKDEIKSDMMSEYRAFIEEGASPAAAYARSINALGNVDELIEEVRKKVITVRPETGLSMGFSGNQRSAAYNFGTGFGKFFRFVTPENEKTIKGAAIAIMWLLITIAYFTASYITSGWNITWLIYVIGAMLNILISLMFDVNSFQHKPYSKREEKRIIKKISGALSGILWLGTALVYFILGAVFSAFSTAWIIFLIAAIMQIILSSFFKLLKG